MFGHVPFLADEQRVEFIPFPSNIQIYIPCQLTKLRINSSRKYISNRGLSSILSPRSIPRTNWLSFETMLFFPLEHPTIQIYASPHFHAGHTNLYLFFYGFHLTFPIFSSPHRYARLNATIEHSAINNSASPQRHT